MIFQFVPLIFLALLALLPGSAHGAQDFKLLAPLQVAEAGEDVVFRFQTPGMEDPKSATLHFRLAGEKIYASLPMKGTRTFSTTLDGTHVRPTELEFFFTVEDDSGRTHFLPEGNAKSMPLTLAVLPSYGSPAVRFSPVSGSQIEHYRPRIGAVFAQPLATGSSVRLKLDEEDVTASSLQTENSIFYFPKDDLEPGPHVASCQIRDSQGNILFRKVWKFTIQENFFDRTSATAFFEGSSKENARINSLLEKGDLSLSFGLRLDDQTGDSLKPLLGSQEADPEKLRVRDYLLQLQKGDQVFALGYVDTFGTGLLGRDNTREGGKISLNFLDAHAEFFHLQDLTGADKDLQHLSGGMIERSFFADQSLYLKAAVLAGSDPDAEKRGLAYSLSFQAMPWQDHLSLFGEFSFSGYGGEEDKPDHAWNLGLSGQGAGVSYGLEYSYFGPEFTSPVNPFSRNDYEQITGSLRKKFSKGHVRVHFERERTNVGLDPFRPVMQTTDLGMEASFAPGGWPRFFTEAGISMKQSSDEPDWYSPVRELSKYYTLGFSLKKPDWSFTPKYSLYQLDHLGERKGGDLKKHVLDLQGRYVVADFMTLRSGFNSTWLLEEGELLERTLNANLDARLLLGDDMQASIGFDYSREEPSWGKESSSFSVDSGYSWRFSEKRDATLGLSGSMTRKFGSEELEDPLEFKVGLRLDIKGAQSGNSLLPQWLPWK